MNDYDKQLSDLKHMNERLEEVNKRIAALAVSIKEDTAKLKEVNQKMKTPSLVELAKTTPPTFGWIINCVGAGLAAGLIIAIINAAFFGGN